MDKKIDQKNNTQDKQKNKVSTGKLLRDVWRFVWGDNSSAQHVEQDLSDISAKRKKKQLKEAKKQQKMEAKARKQAAIKEQQAQTRELRKKKKEERLKELKQRKEEQRLLRKKQKSEQQKVEAKLDTDKEKALQSLAQEKKAASEAEHKQSALRAGLLKKVPGSNSLKAAVLQSDKKKEDNQSGKKLGFWARLFATKPNSASGKKIEKKLAKKQLKQQQEKVVKQVDIDQGLKLGKISMMPKRDEEQIDQADKIEKTKFGYSKHKSQRAKRLAAEREKYANLKIRQDIENRYWHSHKIIRANLIKDQESLFFNWSSKILTLVLAVGLAMLTAGILYGALLVWESNKLNSNAYVFDNLENINREVKREEGFTEEIMAFNDKLVLVDYMLDNHIYWTKFFELLEDHTIVDVYYEGFSGDISGSYNLPTVARDYRSVYLQLKLMQKHSSVMAADTDSAKVLKPQLGDGLEYDESQADERLDRIKFILDLVIDRKLFLKL